MSMDNSAFKIYESEPEYDPDFKDNARVADFKQPTSATRSPIRGAASLEEADDSPLSHHSPPESRLEGTPDSDISIFRRNRFGRPAMDTPYYPALGSSPLSSGDDSSYSHEELQPPQPKRRKGSGAIPFKSISPRTASTISSTPTLQGESVEPALALLPSLDRHHVFTIDNEFNAAIIASSGIVPAAVLRQAFFGAAQTLNYRGPRNPISRHMKFPEEQSSEDEDGDENLWTDGWWSELHEVNGVRMDAEERGNNLVRDRSRDLGGDKEG